MTDDEKRRLNLLEATLKEILRIDSEAAVDPAGSMSLEIALDGALLRRWRDIRKKATSLVGLP